jgi:hypothetical protein
MEFLDIIRTKWLHFLELPKVKGLIQKGGDRDAIVKEILRVALASLQTEREDDAEPNSR